MYTFQLEGLPPNTLPEGMKFVRDCQKGDRVKLVGFITYRDIGGDKPELVYQLKKLEGRPLVGNLRFYGNHGFIGDYNRVDLDYIVEAAE